MITFRIRGTVREEATGVPLPGLFVKAYDRDLLFDDLLGSAFTDARGAFEIVTESRDFRELFDTRPDLYFRISRRPEEEPFHSTRDGVRWNVSTPTEVEIRVPWGHVAALGAPEVRLLGDDGESLEAVEAGESLFVAVDGLQPMQAYDFRVSVDGETLFTSRLLAGARGEIESTALWPQLGLSDPASERRFTPDEAAEHWAGRRLELAVGRKEERVAELSLAIGAGRRPVVVASDREGRVLNAFESDDQPLYLALRNLPFSGPARIYVAPRQHDWRVGDALAAALTREGKPAEVEVELPDTPRQAVLEVLPPGSLHPGAYDFVIRPLRYGYEEDDLPQLLERDLVGSRRVTGLVIRKNFWKAKPVLGGCVNKLSMSGRPTTWGAPYFQYADTFTVGQDVWAALDPGIVDPGNLGKMCALHVVPNKTAVQWNSSNALQHLAVLGGNAAVQKILMQPGCINMNKVKVWPAAMDPGEYDIVADFGNNTGNAGMFVSDHAYDTPLDVIDGYFVTGFRVVQDPGTMTDFANVGTWHYDENIVMAMGMAGTVNVTDEDDFYGTPGGFTPVVRQVRLKAHVFYPADMAGVTDPAQISAAQPDYPLVVIVHGNGQDYVSYDFLCIHLAQNGFVAASIDNRYLSGGFLTHGMHGLGRADNLFKHLAVLKNKFGAKLQNNLGIMGHSRGGEGVVKAARLNQQQALGHNLNAVMSLAPTDQYGREVLGGAWATPYFVLYGSRDGDVAGWSPADVRSWGYPDFTWRMTGFSLYDRAGGAAKSMGFLYGATHNGFITTNSDNVEAGVIPEAKQKDVTKAYANAFFRRRLRGETQWDGMFTGEWKPASVSSLGVELYFQHRATGGKAVDDFEGMPNWQASTLGGMVSQSGLPANPSEGRMIDDPPSDPGLDPHSPHDTQGLRLRWDSWGDRLTWAIPPAHKDVSGYATLSLRITQTEAAGNPAGQPQDLRVALKDGGGNERAIRVGAFAPVPFPDQRANTDLRKSALCTIRIPLTSYTIVCAGQVKVDLHDVTELALVFDQQFSGDIQVDEIEFTS